MIEVTDAYIYPQRMQNKIKVISIMWKLLQKFTMIDMLYQVHFITFLSWKPLNS